MQLTPEKNTKAFVHDAGANASKQLIQVHKPLIESELKTSVELSKGYFLLDDCIGGLKEYGMTNLSARQVKELLPLIRGRLKLTSYLWHPKAQEQYLTLHSYLPPRPGMKKFKANLSLYMLALCCVDSAAWRAAIKMAAEDLNRKRKNGEEMKITVNKK